MLQACDIVLVRALLDKLKMVLGVVISAITEKVLKVSIQKIELVVFNFRFWVCQIAVTAGRN